MRKIPGVGDVKLERYGEEFLAEIRAYQGKGA
jgi:superfamily II DNA helicase RecQ